MGPQSSHDATTSTSAPRRGPLRLMGRTVSRAWNDNIFSEAAEAAFWTTLSLPPLLLGLLGSLGFLGEWFGQQLVDNIHGKIITFSETIFSDNVVQQIIAPTVEDVLTRGRGEIVSLGFVISLWAGSSAISSYVDAVTVAYRQYDVRNAVWQRLFSLLLYLAGLVVAIIGLPVVALGPDILPHLFPESWRPTLVEVLGYFYYPVTGVLLVIALAMFYKVALPHKLPWHRGLPGALLAMAVFLVSSAGLRWYITWVTGTGYTYGALATPIAFLLFAFFIGFAIVLGAHFNAAIQEMWPAKMTHRERRRWRRLGMERVAEQLRLEESQRRWRVQRGGSGDPDGTGTDEVGPAASGGSEDTGTEEDGQRPAHGAEAGPTATPSSAAAGQPERTGRGRHRRAGDGTDGEQPR
ncbi:YihY/virulence factor BrkB family protein [Actinoalloteichus spitiensis]|uniref:YihY/virulence factor BrkB family protein n=1 Tax=Actinoalloteichus spitiensis TaxID=252394 RepID=UPI000363A2D6|nr:YihY/virulence factor BrkB family protein [Actinoalloteichus spitiensis]